MRIKCELSFYLFKLNYFLELLAFNDALIFPLISDMSRENKPDKKILLGLAINLDIIKLQFDSILW